MKWRSQYELANSHEIIASHAYEYYQVSVKNTERGGLGLFADEPIAKQSIIAQDGGVVVTSYDDIPHQNKGYGVVIGEGLYLIPRDYENKEKIFYLNHSCDSNVCRVGNSVYVAKSDISPGQELTIDYATLTSSRSQWTMTCQCKSERCRKLITGNDWMNASLASKLWAEWLPFIQKEIIKRKIL